MGGSQESVGRLEVSFHSISELTEILKKLDCNAETDTLFQGEISLKTQPPREADTLLQEKGSIFEPIETPS